MIKEISSNKIIFLIKFKKYIHAFKILILLQIILTLNKLFQSFLARLPAKFKPTKKNPDFRRNNSNYWEWPKLQGSFYRGQFRGIKHIFLKLNPHMGHTGPSLLPGLFDVTTLRSSAIFVRVTSHSLPLAHPHLYKGVWSPRSSVTSRSPRNPIWRTQTTSQ